MMSACYPAVRLGIGSDQVAISDFQIMLPVDPGLIMLAGADVVAHVTGDVLIQGRHGIGFQSLGAEQGIDRAGILGGQKFAFRVSPQVFGGAGDNDRPGRGQGYQEVLVKGMASSLAMYWRKDLTNQCGMALTMNRYVSPKKRRAVAPPSRSRLR